MFHFSTITKLFIYTCLSIVVFHSLPAGANDSFASLPHWVEHSEVNYINQNNEDLAVDYLLYDHQVNIASEPKSSFVHVAVRVNRERGISDISQLEINYFPAYESFKFHQIQIIRNGQVIDLSDQIEIKHFQNEDGLKNNIYQEKYTALAVLSDIRVNDVIEYSYSHTGRNPVLGQSHFGFASLNFDIPVYALKFRLLANKQSELNFRVVNSDLVVNKSRQENLIEYRLDGHNIAAAKPEDYAPSWYPSYAWLEYSEYNDWQEVRLWAEALYPTEYSLPDELIGIIDQLKTDDKLASAAKITQWIQENIRYFGVEFGENSHMPSSPVDTFERRYGDCKDKSVLLIAALQKLGIDAYPAFVSTTIKRSLQEMLPSPGAFNHVIVHFNIDAVDYWVDPTMTSQKGQLIDMALPDLELALVANIKNSGLSKIVAVSERQKEANVSIAEQLTISHNQSAAQLDVSTRYSGWKAEQMRYYLDGVGTKSASESYTEYYAKYYKEVSESAPLTIEEQDNKNQLTMLESYQIDKLFDTDNDKNLMTVSASSIIDSLWLPNVRNRQAPFETIALIEIQHTTEVLLQDNGALIWLESTLEKNIKNPWFSYTRNVVKQESGLLIQHNFKTLERVIPSQHFADYVRDLEQLESSLSYRFKLASNIQQRQQRVKSLVKDLLNKGAN